MAGALNQARWAFEFPDEGAVAVLQANACSRWKFNFQRELPVSQATTPRLEDRHVHPSLPAGSSLVYSFCLTDM